MAVKESFAALMHSRLYAIRKGFDCMKISRHAFNLLAGGMCDLFECGNFYGEMWEKCI